MTETKVPLTTICALLLLLICIGESHGALSCYKCGQYNDGVGSITPCINSTAQMHLQECPTSSKWCIVKRRIKLGDEFTNVKLPVSESLPYCEVLPFAGWYTPISTWSATLKATQIILVHDKDCNVQHSNEHFCVNIIDRVGQLGPGDSGSPLVHNNTLYGIILGGADTAGSPFVFTKIFHHIDFITEVLEKGKESNIEKKSIRSD